MDSTTYKATIPTAPAIMEAYAKPARGLPAMRGISDIRLGFRVNFFFGEDFVYLYDELFTSGKMSSRSWWLPRAHPPVDPILGDIAAQAAAVRLPGSNLTY
jgi:hypothetical protein